MKRVPLERKTPLKPKAPIKRSAKKGQRKAPPEGFTDAVKAEVRRRSKNMCEMKGCDRRAGHFHHRKLRRFGDHRVCNTLHLCNHCHLYVHDHPAEAYLMGWLVRSFEDPAAVPVR